MRILFSYVRKCDFGKHDGDVCNKAPQLILKKQLPNARPYSNEEEEKREESTAS
jgi:hypothetical protein